MDPTPTAAEFEDRLGELKEVKLKLPLRHHVTLHSLKLLRNQSISEIVAVALDAYFARASLAPGGRVMAAADDVAAHAGFGDDPSSH